MTGCYTGASLSKKSFFANYYKQQKYPLYSLDDKMDKYIRDFYYGGRVEIFHLGKVPDKKFYYYDFTSLYPDRGRELLPYGKPVWISGERIDVLDFFGFVNVKVKSIHTNKKPLHAIKENGKLMFRHFVDWTDLNLFSEELKLGIQSGMYEYKIESGLSFQSAKWLDKFFTDAFVKKAEAKKSGNPALAQTYKIIANSGYGFWGLRVKDRDTIKICEKDKSVVYDYLHKGKFMNLIKQRVGKGQVPLLFYVLKIDFFTPMNSVQQPVRLVGPRMSLEFFDRVTYELFPERLGTVPVEPRIFFLSRVILIRRSDRLA